MLPKLSLLDELRKGGYEASLITTFNAYLPFYEEVVLRRLVNAGVRHNVLLMDAQQYGVSLHNHPPRLAGRQYTLMPISVPGAFHPKLIFLVGKQKGLVLVGSHNMTLSGFGFNRELTNVMRIRGKEDKAGSAIGARVWEEIIQWTEASTHKLPQQVVDMVLRVKDFAPWINNANRKSDSDTTLLASRPGSETLWNQLLDLAKNKVTDIFLTGAFFDNQLSFIKRIQSDLQPKRLFVAIDPKTVQIPTKQKSLSGVTFVRADSLGTDEDETSSGYLHAKGMFLRMENNESLFISGSANPSRPAWLAKDHSGNTELMLVRSGEDAETIAEEMGFSLIPDMPLLDDSDWNTISCNKHDEKRHETSSKKVGVAVIEDNKVIIDADLVVDFKNADLILLNTDIQEIAQTTGFTAKADQYLVTFRIDDLPGALILRCINADDRQADFLLHHARVVEEQARTSVQRRFRDALLSLESDTPNIGLLIECVDKIVFSDSTTSRSDQSKRGHEKHSDSNDEDLDSQSLGIDVSDIKKKKSKHRLTHTGDFAYLLDTLIFHLRLQDDRAKEDIDRYGRTEEEQVGSDDDESAGTGLISEQQRVELLSLCHSKVHTVITRMISQLRAYSLQKVPLDIVLFRLLGVLAVIRELRSCDGRVQWVDKGSTTVPPEERLRLFEEVMLSLFEGKTSLLHLETLGDEFTHSDDVARLKGLLLWLAWDCGLVFDLQKPFMESKEKLESRLKHNAMILALAQAIQSDESVTDEARQSIGIFTSSEMDWLKEIQSVALHCDGLRDGKFDIQLPEEVQPGDIALHKNIKNWDLRVVAKSGGNITSLIRLSRDKDIISFMPEHLSIARLDPTV